MFSFIHLQLVNMKFRKNFTHEFCVTRGRLLDKAMLIIVWPLDQSHKSSK